MEWKDIGLQNHIKFSTNLTIIDLTIQQDCASRWKWFSDVAARNLHYGHQIPAAGRLINRNPSNTFITGSYM
jgi:hypothetical protein